MWLTPKLYWVNFRIPTDSSTKEKSISRAQGSEPALPKQAFYEGIGNNEEFTEFSNSTIS